MFGGAINLTSHIRPSLRRKAQKHDDIIEGRAAELTLQVEEGTDVGGGVGRRLRDGQQEGPVASQQAAHEAQERLLDLQLQLLLASVDLVIVGQQEFQRRLLLTRGANCSQNKGMMEKKVCDGMKKLGEQRDTEATTDSGLM